MNELIIALQDLVGDGGIIEDDCECDNTHEEHGTVCCYCHAREVLKKYQAIK